MPQHGKQTELVEERCKPGDHPILHHVSEPRQRPCDPVPSAWPFLIERYMEVELEGHIHFWIGRVGRPACDLCAIFRKGLEPEGRPVGCAGRHRADPVRDSGNGGSNHVDEPMFVGVVQLMEEPEGMSLSSVLVPSVIRLNVLGDCLGVVAGPAELRDAPPAIVGPTPEDWELRTGLIRRRIAGEDEGDGRGSSAGGRELLRYGRPIRGEVAA